MAPWRNNWITLWTLKGRTLPYQVYRRSAPKRGFIVRVSGKYVGSYQTVKEAVAARDKYVSARSNQVGLRRAGAVDNLA